MILPSGADELLKLRQSGKIWEGTLCVLFGIDKCNYLNVKAKPRVKYDWRFVYKADCIIFWNFIEDWRESAKQIIKYCNPPLELFDCENKSGCSLWWSPTMDSIEKCIRYNLPRSKLKYDFSELYYPDFWNEKYYKVYCNELH